MASIDSFCTVVSARSSLVASRIAFLLLSLRDAMRLNSTTRSGCRQTDTIRLVYVKGGRMKLGRIWRQGPDGDVERLVAVHPGESRVVDLAAAESLRLQRQGATVAAARRLSAALFPSSMAAAIALGLQFTEAARRADDAAGADASLP